jgi:hypothetical protein
MISMYSSEIRQTGASFNKRALNLRLDSVHLEYAGGIQFLTVVTLS